MTALSTRTLRQAFFLVLAALVLSSCSNSDGIVVGTESVDEVAESLDEGLGRPFSSLPVGPIDTTEDLAALRGTAWIAYPHSDPPTYGAVSFAWDPDDGLIGSFSDECSQGTFAVSTPTATAWEVDQTGFAGEVGCVGGLSQIFRTGVEIRLSRTDTGLFVEAPNVGFFDAVHWQSTSVHDDPLDLTVSEDDVDSSRLEDRVVTSTTIDLRGPNIAFVDPELLPTPTTLLPSQDTSVPFRSYRDMLFCVEEGLAHEERTLAANEDGFGTTALEALAEFERNFDLLATRPDLMETEPIVDELEYSSPLLAAALYTDADGRNALLVQIVAWDDEWETERIVLCAP